MDSHLSSITELSRVHSFSSIKYRGFYMWNQRFMESITMEERKWEELKRDCLVEILARVGTESLVESIPFVCKSWCHATLDPHCWETLSFPNRHVSTELVKFVVDRSQGSATSVVFQTSCTEHGLIYISDKCPELKVLGLSHETIWENFSLISGLIGKWKNLELFVKGKGMTSVNAMMYMDDDGSRSQTHSHYFEQILKSISIHCMNFVGLDWSYTYFEDEDVAAIVNFLPKIKKLQLGSSCLSRNEVVMILKGCRELEHLDVSNCIGFKADNELLELGSHIKDFNCSNSKYDDIFDQVTNLLSRIDNEDMIRHFDMMLSGFNTEMFEE